jgi:transposase
LGVFDCIFAALAGEGSKPERILINTTHLKAHRTAASLLKKGAVPRRIGWTKRGLNSTLHAVCDGEGKPLILLLSEGQMSDHRGARLVVDALPPTSTLIADRGYYSNGFREALLGKGITPCILSGQKASLPHGKVLYRQRYTIENMFAKLKDWRRVATRYDRRTHTFFSAICIAAAVIFYLNQ